MGGEKTAATKLTSSASIRRFRYSRLRREREVRRNRRILFCSALLLCLFVFTAVPGKNVRRIQRTEEALPSARSSAVLPARQKVSAWPEGVVGFVRGICMPWDPVQVKAQMSARPQSRSGSGSIGLSNVRTCFRQCVTRLLDEVYTHPMNPSMMTDYDYEILLQIVEAEAGTEDLKGRVLVANVILNRVRDPEFPDTVTDVVFEYNNGVAQFSPVDDGRIYEVSVSDGTRKAVRLALDGADYSQGALFFIQKEIADADSALWFDRHLQFLFKYGVHEFYKYPQVTEPAA